MTTDHPNKTISGDHSTIIDIDYQEYITRFWIFALGQKMVCVGPRNNSNGSETLWSRAKLPNLLVKRINEFEIKPLSEEEFKNEAERARLFSVLSIKTKQLKAKLEALNSLEEWTKEILG